MPQEKLDDNLPCLQLRNQPTQTSLIVIGRRTKRELVAEFLRQFPFEAQRGLIVDAVPAWDKAKRQPQLVLRQPLHAHEEPALSARSSTPFGNYIVDRLPAAKIEVAYT